MSQTPKRGPARTRKPKPAKQKAMTGPKSMFRGKVREPLTLLLTKNGREVEQYVREKTKLSRGDLYELMLLTFGKQVIEEYAQPA